MKIKFTILAGLMMAACNINAQTSDEITVTDKFCGGIIAGSTISDDTVYIDIYQKNNSGWYAFRIDGVKGKKVNFVLTGRRLYYTGERAAITYDFKNFEHSEILSGPTESGLYEAHRITRSVFSHTFTESPAYVSRFLPVSVSMVNEWIETLDKKNLTVRSLGYSSGVPDGGPNGCVVPTQMKMLEITDSSIPDKNKKIYFVLGNECCWEQASTITNMGMIEFLLSDDPLAVAARKKTIWKIIPLPNIDCRNGGRVESLVDQNFDRIHVMKESWRDTTWRSRIKEVDLIMDEIERIHASGKKIYFGLRLHSWAYTNGLSRINTECTHDSTIGKAIVKEVIASGKNYTIDSKPMALTARFAPQPLDYDRWGHHIFYDTQDKFGTFCSYEQCLMTGMDRSRTLTFDDIKQHGEALVKGLIKATLPDEVTDISSPGKKAKKGKN